MSGRCCGSAFNIESIRSFNPCEYAEFGCLYCAFMTAIAIEPPCSVVCVFSNGECEYARAKRVHPRDYIVVKVRISILIMKGTYPDVDFLVYCDTGLDVE